MRKFYLLFFIAFNFVSWATTAQTTLNAGDIAFVAYRANATGTTDEAAFLTFVNIAAGTTINFTDAKYTDNATPQCSGGFTWTAPAEGVAAGTVVKIVVDGTPSTTVGTVSGAGFGLSSSGDQIIAYQGTNSSPTHITAISTNAWATITLTSCSGNFSKIPATLTDGLNAINMSAAPGNTTGNTVNAFYSGTQSGTVAELKSAIFNAANWTGVGSGTTPQTWPTFTFPGPPSVTSATIVSQNSIQLNFNNTLNSATATNVNNFTGLGTVTSATLEANNKTITLVFATGFSGASSLVVSNITDTDGRSMFSPYTYNFNYQTTVKFDKRFARFDESTGAVSIKVIVTFPSTSSVDVEVLNGGTANANDYTFTKQTLNFTGSSVADHFINLTINNDTEAEQDEYVILKFTNQTGLTSTGGDYYTLYIKDNDRTAPVATKDIELSYLASFDPGASTAEIVVHDPATQRLFIISSVQDRLDIADFSNPAAVTLIKSIDMSTYGGITSVSVKNGVVAAASPAVIPQDNGQVVFFNTNGDYLNKVTVGALPDNVSFTPDGTKVLTANEGEPNDDYSNDPKGSVSIIDISGGIAGLTAANVTTVDFEAYNSQEAALKAQGVRKLKSGQTLAQEFEPEYITYSADSKKAWVTIQENNAMAEINLTTKSISSVWGLGKKDMSQFKNGFDASDNNGIVVIANWPVKSFFIPDAVSSFTFNNTNYLVTANEGDEKELSGLNERTTVGAVTLDATAFPTGAVLKENHNLGRFRITNTSGDTDGDGDYDELNSVGTRSFSIWDADAKNLVFDSGDDFEQIIANDPVYGALFNSDHETNSLKNRSRSKGPEPEGVTVAELNDKIYAFISLERIGGVMVYDISNPASPKFVDYKNNRGTASYSGDHGPEGLIYIKRENSPNNKAYVLVANEISGTVSIYQITPDPKLDQTITFGSLTDKTVGNPAFNLTATSSSGLTVAFSTSDDEITINNTQVSLVKAGKVTIKADQAGNSTYNKAATVSQTFCIKPAKPVISLSSGNNTETVTLQSSATLGNQWYLNEEPLEAANPTLEATSPGSYTVISTVETCESEVSDAFILVITDIERIPQGQIKMYPNPVEETIFVHVPVSGTKVARVVTTNGVEQLTTSSNSDVLEIDVRSLAKGLYLLNIQTSKGLVRGRFVKK